METFARTAALSSTLSGGAAGNGTHGNGSANAEPRSGSPFERLYRPISSHLREVETRLQREFQSRWEELRPILAQGALLGGKRLRPALVLLSGGAAGTIGSDHVTVAAIIEMLHTATLVHDDVLDDATNRRHRPTINAKWNTGASILLGDFLFAHSYYLAAQLDSLRVCRIVGSAARKVCEGELRQFLLAGNISIDKQRYYQLIGGKTAELTSASCEIGAELAGASQRVCEALRQYGYSLGMAFQIADDYLDIWGEPDRVGKTLGSDLLQGKATLPLIRLLEQSSPQEVEEIERIIRGPIERRLTLMLPRLDQSDAKQYTLDVAHSFVREARDALSLLPPTTARESLLQLAEMAVTREA